MPARPPPPGEAHHAPEKTGERALTQIANRLCELIEQVGRVRIDRDDKREFLTLLLTDRYGTELPAKALSDGTLRFLALASAGIDPILTGLICMEESENGIHPERIGAMIRLLRDITTHSPVVVRQVPDDTLVFAVPEQRVVEGNLIGSGDF